MKKWTRILAGALTASLVLVACGQKKEEPTSTSSSSKVSSTSSTSSKKSEKSAGSTANSGEVGSQEGSVSSTQEPAVTSSLDMQAIASGDFSSMIGTWQDANGVSYTFDERGIVSDVAKLETDYAKLDENGLYLVGIRWNNFTGAAFLIFPAGKSLPADKTADGTDPTDTSQDRFIIAQSISEHPDVFYRVK